MFSNGTHVGLSLVGQFCARLPTTSRLQVSIDSGTLCNRHERYSYNHGALARLLGPTADVTIVRGCEVEGCIGIIGRYVYAPTS